MIGKFSSLYAGHVDLPDMGQMATPAVPSGSRGSRAGPSMAPHVKGRPTRRCRPDLGRARYSLCWQRSPNTAFLRIAGSTEDHHLGLFEQPGVTGPDEGAVRMYHSAWEVGELTDLVRARRRLIEARSLVGPSDHGVSLSLYAKDPDGLEFEVFWTVPGGRPVGTRALDLEGELARRGIPMPEAIDVAPPT